MAPVKDHRRLNKGNIQYSVSELFFLSIVGIVCGCDGWEGISLFGKLKLDWFRKFYPYRKGVPSQDTLERFFGKLSSETFGQSFVDWAAQCFKSIDNEVVSIDGKRIRGSYDILAGQGATHTVSAYATANGITLGQVATGDKSNEITAIPQLLGLIDIVGTVVSIDAMGCQVSIASKIRERQADYLLAVKGNQEGLYEDILLTFRTMPPNGSDTWFDVGHGRVERRTCDVVTSLDWVEGKEKWPDLAALVRITTERGVKTTGEIQHETRYYITSKKFTAKEINRMVRSHWAIENKLHWVLDVTFKEDRSRRRKGNSAFNFNVMAKVAIRLLEKNKGNLTKPMARMKATVDDQFRELIFKDF